MRPSMGTLVDHLRLLVGDVPFDDPLTSTFSDDELQAFLDERSSGTSLAVLTPDTLLSGSPTIYRSAVRWWESDIVLSTSGGTLTAHASSDNLAGVWVFATAPTSPVYVTGRYFDMYGSAVSALQAWAARLAIEYDFQTAGTGGLGFARSQKSKGMLAVSKEYARKSISPGMRSPIGLSPWEL